jgi:hypothetical protein
MTADVYYMFRGNKRRKIGEIFRLGEERIYKTAPYSSKMNSKRLYWALC